MQAPNWTDFLSCSVCMSKYNCLTVVPVSLSCCHTICKRCLSRLKTNTCPYDRTPIPMAMSSYPPNTSLLLLLGFDQKDWSHEMANLCPTVLSDSELEGFNKACESMENLAMFLRPFIEQGVLQATASIPRPVLKKLVTLLNCQILDSDGRGKALRAAHSIAERTITELLIMHQNPQQIPALLWTAVRNRGCQFLGPIMQEEALKLILKVLESGRYLSRKNIVLYVVQQLQSDFPNASKTNIGHVVQLLYRASCFNVEKREDESSLMQLKEEYRTYETLRREHDAQIIRIAMEAGLRITPETWSTQLYGNTNRKSEMQSIIDKLVSQGVASSGLSELIVAIGRSQDPQGLSEKLVPHLDTLLKIVQPTEKLTDPTSPDGLSIVPDLSSTSTSWEPFSQGIKELLLSLQAFTDFSQIHYKDRSETMHGQVAAGKYKTGICPYLSKPGGCPRGHLCPYAHSEEEKRRFVNIAKTNRRGNASSGVSGSGNISISGKTPPSQSISLPVSSQSSRGGSGIIQRGPPMRQPSDELSSSSPYSSLEESNGYGSFPGGTVMYPSDPRIGTTFVVQSPMSNLPLLNMGGNTLSNPTIQTGVGQTGQSSFYQGPSSLEGYSAPSSVTYQGYNETPYDGRSIGRMDSFPKSGYVSSLPYHSQLPPRSQPPPTHTSSSSVKSDIPLTETGTHHYSSSKMDSSPEGQGSLVPPTSVPVSISDSWKYKQSSLEGGSPPSSVRLKGEQGDEGYGLQSAMGKLKLSGEDAQQGGGEHREQLEKKALHVDQSHAPQNVVNELTARIQHLEAELENSRRREEPHIDATPPYQSTLPNYYGSSPHSGEIMRGSDFSGPIQMGPPPPPTHHPHQYPQNQTGSLPVDTGYYHPLYGLPGHIPGHPWSGPLGTVMVSPHTTPPNTQLLMTNPTQPPPPPNGLPQRPVPMVPPPDHYSQIESDAMIAHFIQFAEQSKAQGYPIAPGAHLTPSPMVHQGPAHHYQGFNYRPHPQVHTGKHMYKS